MGKVVRIGTRESKLAVIQAELVAAAIEKHRPEIETRLVTMKTTGDKILDRTLDSVGGKGLLNAFKPDRFIIETRQLQGIFYARENRLILWIQCSRRFAV